MVIVIRQGSVNLPERQVGMLKVHFLRAPSVGELIKYDLYYFGVGTRDPRPATGIQLDVARDLN